MKRLPACSVLFFQLDGGSILASENSPDGAAAPRGLLALYRQFIRSSNSRVIHSSLQPSMPTLSMQSTAFISNKFVPPRQFLLSRRLPNLFARPTTTTTSSISEERSRQDQQQHQPVTRIGIVGGGIAGVSIAHALCEKKYSAEAPPPFHITVIEGDPPSLSNSTRGNYRPWTAATARNANSLVPGAAMHVFSRPSVIWQVLQDTVHEWYLLQFARIKKAVGSSSAEIIDDETLFVKPPPYFALHLINCLGPKASAAERWSFVNFVSQFLYAAMSGGADERGKRLCQLAKANRAEYLKAVDRVTAKTTTAKEQYFGHSQGFITLHRSQKPAEEAVDEMRAHGEAAELITDWEDVVQWEPRLAHLPMAPNLYAVRRLNDYTASCESFIRQWIEESRATGVVEYKQDSGNVVRLQIIPTSSTEMSSSSSTKVKTRSTEERVFRVVTEDGSSHDFDLLVLAAGTATPLLAAQLGAARFCPTYPLRGYSLTAFVDDEKDEGKSSRDMLPNGNLLRQPFSIDSLYCSSVTPKMARLAGFGEFVGYRDKAVDVPSLGPAVLSRYARKIFPDAVHTAPDDALSCFRSLSPDDLPLAGEIPTHPGLFLHTGHGTLGWTCGLATGECVAQSIVDRMKGHYTQEGTFTLADNTTIDRRILSPKRFVG